MPDAQQAQDAMQRANDRLRSFALARGFDQVLPFLCECTDEDCLGRIEMTTAEYGDTHAGDGTYIVLRSHPLVEGERVVDDRGSYLVVGRGA